VIAELKIAATYVAAPEAQDGGRPIVLQYAVIDTFRDDGKIVHERFYWDPEQLRRQVA
jgi:ketosteroid isomerase-like protein